MKDIHKNMIALLVITVIVSIITEYAELATGWFWLMILCGVTLWFIVSPFKFYDDVQ